MALMVIHEVQHVYGFKVTGNRGARQDSEAIMHAVGRQLSPATKTGATTATLDHPAIEGPSG